MRNTTRRAHARELQGLLDLTDDQARTFATLSVPRLVELLALIRERGPSRPVIAGFLDRVAIQSLPPILFFRQAGYS